MRVFKIIAGVGATLLGGIGLGILFLALTPKYVLAPLLRKALSK